MPSSATLRSLSDRCAVAFRCQWCAHTSSWTAVSLAERFGPAATLEGLAPRLRCHAVNLHRLGHKEDWRLCGGPGVASIIAPDDALGPDGKTSIGEIYGVKYPSYCPEAAKAKGWPVPLREDWINAVTEKIAPDSIIVPYDLLVVDSRGRDQ
jgi:hypothetical protein